MSTDTPTVVLVHGALTDASVWRHVTAHLHGSGLRVLAPALPLRGLDEDAAYLHSVLTGCDGPILVAAHSWGGSVISHPGALTPAVRGLVFAAAFAPDTGETTGELNDRFPGSGLGPETTVVHQRASGPELFLRPEHFAEVYAADLDPAEARVLAGAQRGIRPDALGESFPGPPTWRAVPSWALVATDDGSLPVRTQRFMAGRAGSAVTEVRSSHAVPLAHPKETAEVVLTAAHAA
jgi:pimeloyl-ACP methyl ester carboxylesterase